MRSGAAGNGGTAPATSDGDLGRGHCSFGLGGSDCSVEGGVETRIRAQRLRGTCGCSSGLSGGGRRCGTSGGGSGSRSYSLLSASSFPLLYITALLVLQRRRGGGALRGARAAMAHEG